MAEGVRDSFIENDVIGNYNIGTDLLGGVSSRKSKRKVKKRRKTSVRTRRRRKRTVRRMVKKRSSKRKTKKSKKYPHWLKKYWFKKKRR